MTMKSVGMAANAMVLEATKGDIVQAMEILDAAKAEQEE